jgi:hypothetical protein
VRDKPIRVTYSRRRRRRRRSFITFVRLSSKGKNRKSSFLARSPYSNDDEHQRSITVVDGVFVFRAEKYEDDLA